MPLIVTLAMIVVTLFSLAKSNAGLLPATDGPSQPSELVGHVLTFVLGIYGGFFSGGYVAFLTATFVAFFGDELHRGSGHDQGTQPVFVFGCNIVFAVRGLIDWRLGLILGLSSFVGAAAGAMLAQHMSNVLLRRIFLVAVTALAVRTMLSDFFG